MSVSQLNTSVRLTTTLFFTAGLYNRNYEDMLYLVYPVSTLVLFVVRLCKQRVWVVYVSVSVHSVGPCVQLTN